MFLTGRGLGHANGEQRHKAGGRHNKTSKHAALATGPQARPIPMA
jgi:hypothetical protein